MKRTWTIIGVRDVPGRFKCYQALFGQPETPPGRDRFGQLRDTDGTVLLCLHQWGAHEHPSLMSPDEGSPGNGLLLFFRVDDYDEALDRARAIVARFEEEPHVNPNTRTREFSLRDADGYYVTISALSAHQGSVRVSTRGNPFGSHHGNRLSRRPRHRWHPGNPHRLRRDLRGEGRRPAPAQRDALRLRDDRDGDHGNRRRDLPRPPRLAPRRAAGRVLRDHRRHHGAADRP